MTGEAVLGRVSAACRSRLLGTLSVRLSTQLDLPGEEPYPPGAIDYASKVYLTWYPDDDGPDDQQVFESIARQGRDIDDGIRFEVGRGQFVLVDLLQPRLYDALDAREADLEELGTVLFSKGDHDRYDIEDELLAPGSHAVLVNRVEIDPIWRGQKLGLLSTGVALLELGRGCSFAALDAMQPGIEDETRRQSVHKRLTWYWRQLGFDSWRERVMVLDLGATTLDDKIAELTARYKVPTSHLEKETDESPDR